MKSKRRRLGLLSKAKHAVSNKKYEWEQERQESKVMKAKADEVGKAKAKKAKKKQLERQATDKYRRKYGVADNPISTTKQKPRKNSRPKRSTQSQSSKPQASYDPFGVEGLFK
jgi:hypothetical protein